MVLFKHIVNYYDFAKSNTMSTDDPHNNNANYNGFLRDARQTCFTVIVKHTECALLLVDAILHAGDTWRLGDSRLIEQAANKTKHPHLAIGIFICPKAVGRIDMPD